MVDFHGRWHRVNNAGLNPLPVQRPIPVWLGGGTLGDQGPFYGGLRPLPTAGAPASAPTPRARRTGPDRTGATWKKAGRDPAPASTLEGRIWTAGKQPEDWLGEAKLWEELGATHLVVETRKAGLAFPGRTS